MVLCIEPQKIYSPGGCHEIAFPSTFSHNGPRPTTLAQICLGNIYMLHKLRSGHLTGTKSPFAIFAVILAVILFGYVYPHLNIYNTSYFTPMFENNRKRGGGGGVALVLIVL